MKTRTGVVGVVLLVVMMIAGAAVAASHLNPSTTDAQSVYWFADETDTGGNSFLTRTDGMVLAVVEAEELTPGDAYTLWWVVFNNPDECSEPGCGEDDIFAGDDLNIAGIEAAQIGIGNATGNVAKADGTAEFGGRLKKNDTSGAHEIVFPAGLTGDALLTVSGNDAEVHVIVQNHGQARGGPQLLNQLTYLEAGCTPLCGDVQFSVHKP